MTQRRIWRFHVETYAASLLLTVAIILVNLLPIRSQLHGWPFVYMVRESRVPGNLTMFYGPWPFYEPPVLMFDSMDLVLNVSIGILLLIAFMFATEYWVRFFGMRARFGLRSLLAIITLACVVLAYFRGQAAFFLLFVCPKYLVYFSIIICIFSVGHWLGYRANSRPT